MNRISALLLACGLLAGCHSSAPDASSPPGSSSNPAAAPATPGAVPATPGSVLPDQCGAWTGPPNAQGEQVQIVIQPDATGEVDLALKEGKFRTPVTWKMEGPGLVATIRGGPPMQVARVGILNGQMQGAVRGMRPGPNGQPIPFQFNFSAYTKQDVNQQAGTPTPPPAAAKGDVVDFMKSAGVPLYPGATPVGIRQVDNQGRSMMVCAMTAKDGLEQVTAYYAKALSQATRQDNADGVAFQFNSPQGALILTLTKEKQGSGTRIGLIK